MTKFVAIKIHYDHRKSLRPHLKYSKVPTPQEYKEYLDLFREEGIGGEGFHECLNFSVRDGSPTKIYLPPTCIPDNRFSDEEMVFFSFTYKGDKELPSSIVGVHAAAKLKSVDREAIERDDIESIEGADKFHYHAEAPSEFTTLITPPIEYNFRDGLYTPKYQFWGNGLRYISEEHAENIINTALAGANSRILRSKGAEAIVIEREISVLEAIKSRYFSSPASKNSKAKQSGSSFGGANSIPDKELGYLGEKFIYESELEYVLKHGLPASDVEWVSQSVPQSPYDIKTVRVINKEKHEHFIEVKSSRAVDESNIYLSSRQVQFFQENHDCATFKFVTFATRNEVKSVRELDFIQLSKEFELVPIKFKLRHHSASEA